MSEFKTPSGVALSVSVTSSGGSPPSGTSEEVLRRQLRAALQRMAQREPLEPSYKRLLQRNTITRQPATIPKNKFYKAIGSRLRERVEVYSREIQGKDPFDRIMQRKPLVEQEMRTAFTLREAKDYEQKPLLEATLIATAMHPERKRSLDGMALFLQARKEKVLKVGSSFSAVSRTEAARQQTLLENQKQQARQWEEARLQRERDERRRREEELASERRKRESGPQAALQKIIEPVFRKLWEMEFATLGGSNPFRIVIDRETAQHIAPDYFSVITTPMNLTYIQEKVRKMQYSTLPEFFGDVDLMINNALKYNLGEENPYRIAALELKAFHEKIVKRVWKSIQEKQQNRNK
ncbi:bromodomain containing protein [Nitzschia inconspicua]|uniref:Bromodomain containing protein n=1 Tax=Nitzschia inconspicua TaxID=303405 RepID=A0A9K3LHL9_9STRA|nr:bromodomain containing protein [Nitzschia inconspicua]